MHPLHQHVQVRPAAALRPPRRLRGLWAAAAAQVRLACDLVHPRQLPSSAPLVQAVCGPARVPLRLRPADLCALAAACSSLPHTHFLCFFLRGYYDGPGPDEREFYHRHPYERDGPYERCADCLCCIGCCRMPWLPLCALRLLVVANKASAAVGALPHLSLLPTECAAYILPLPAPCLLQWPAAWARTVPGRAGAGVWRVPCPAGRPLGTSSRTAWAPRPGRTSRRLWCAPAATAAATPGAAGARGRSGSRAGCRRCRLGAH